MKLEPKTWSGVVLLVGSKTGRRMVTMFKVFFFFKFVSFFQLSMNTRDKTYSQREGPFSHFSGQEEREGTNGNAVRKPVIKINGTNFRLKFKISKTVI